VDLSVRAGSDARKVRRGSLTLILKSFLPGRFWSRGFVAVGVAVASAEISRQARLIRQRPS